MTDHEHEPIALPEEADGSVGGVTSIARTIDRVVSTDDPVERRRLARALGVQIERLVGKTADNAQLAVWSTEEWLRQQIGATNEMISQLAEDSRAARADQREMLESVRQLIELGTDTAQRMTALENAQGLMAGHMSTLTARITDLVEGYNDLNRRVAVLEEASTDKVARLERIEVKLDVFEREALIRELDRRRRLLNLAFLEIMMEHFPDLADRARRRMTEREMSHDGAGA